MKTSLMAVLMLLLVACKPEVQSAKISTLGENQIAISGSMTSSSEVLEFAREIERRQEQDPDKIFEIVKSEKSSATSGTILSHLNDDHLYTNKNFYIFIALGKGDKNTGIQKTDWDAVYYIMSYVSNLKYRVLINVNATSEHLRLASEDKDTAVILWSSHGNPQGFYDYNGDKVPYDVFKNKSKSFYQLILSSCNGRLALDKFYDTSGLRTWAWEGLTTSNDLKSFLLSDTWSIEDGKSLVKPVNGITCSKTGKGIVMIQDSTLFELYGHSFENVDACKARINTIKSGSVCSAGEKGIRKVNTATLELSSAVYESMSDCLNR